MIFYNTMQVSMIVFAFAFFLNFAMGALSTGAKFFESLIFALLVVAIYITLTYVIHRSVKGMGLSK